MVAPMQVPFPCKCATRELVGVYAPLEDVQQHLRDAHGHAGAVHGERWKAADIDADVKGWRQHSPTRLLSLANELPMLPAAEVFDATDETHGRVQVALNADGSIRSVHTVREGEDGVDVTPEFVQAWDRKPYPRVAKLTAKQRHGA